METKLFILLCMLFCHIVDDYYLQGWLASAKQKSWWKSNAPGEKYKNDYKMALFMHSFSWSFMIMLAPTVYIFLFGGKWIPLYYVANTVVHMYVDNWKANRKEINLIQDQILHMFQILCTWHFMIVI